MANSFRLYLDLDRTLFDTPAAMDVLQRSAEQLYNKQGVTAKKLYGEYKNFCTYIGEQYYHRLFDHLASYGIIRSKVEADLRPLVSSHDFCIPTLVPCWIILTAKTYRL